MGMDYGLRSGRGGAFLAFGEVYHEFNNEYRPNAKIALKTGMRDAPRL